MHYKGNFWTYRNKILGCQSPHSYQSAHHPIKQEAADGRLVRTAGFEVFCPSVCQSSAAAPAALTSVRLRLSKSSGMCQECTASAWRRRWRQVVGRMIMQELHLVVQWSGAGWCVGAEWCLIGQQMQNQAEGVGSAQKYGAGLCALWRYGWMCACVFMHVCVYAYA